MTRDIQNLVKGQHNKKNDTINKKSIKSDLNKIKDVPGKKLFENQDKRDMLEKIVGNLDKSISGKTIKIQQNSAVSSQKNVPPFY
jgi:hypothetical protein